jgi:hypothetical protein
VVNFPGASVREGEIADVLITEAKTNSLYGTVVNEPVIE